MLVAKLHVGLDGECRVPLQLMEGGTFRLSFVGHTTFWATSCRLDATTCPLRKGAVLAHHHVCGFTTGPTNMPLPQGPGPVHNIYKTPHSVMLFIKSKDKMNKYGNVGREEQSLILDKYGYFKFLK